MTTMKTCSLLLVTVATAIVCTSAAPSPAPAYPDPSYPCPWRKVPDPESPFIQKLGSWAVKQEHIFFYFDKVLSAKVQGVGSCTSISTRNKYYELIIKVSNHGGDIRHIMAVVYVVNFTQPQKVMSFDAVIPPAAN